MAKEELLSDMATPSVEPGLIFDRTKGQQVPVWCLQSKNKGHAIPFTVFWERKHRDGFVPVGTDCFKRNEDGTTVKAVRAIPLPPGMKFAKILREKDGYVAPDTWYVVEEPEDSEDLPETEVDD